MSEKDLGSEISFIFSSIGPGGLISLFWASVELNPERGAGVVVWSVLGGLFRLKLVPLGTDNQSNCSRIEMAPSRHSLGQNSACHKRFSVSFFAKRAPFLLEKFEFGR